MGEEHHGLSEKLRQCFTGGPASDDPWKIFFDGAASETGQHAGIGVVVLDPSGKVVEKVVKYIGASSYTEAEYKGLIKALELVKGHGAEYVQLYGDSEVVCQQVKAGGTVEGEIGKLHQRVGELAGEFKSFGIQHVPREENKADVLASKAVDSQGNEEKEKVEEEEGGMSKILKELFRGLKKLLAEEGKGKKKKKGKKVKLHSSGGYGHYGGSEHGEEGSHGEEGEAEEEELGSSAESELESELSEQESEAED